MIRRTTAAVVGGAVALVGLGTATASAVPAPALYKLAYADSLFTATVDDQGTDIRDVSYQEWQALGFPAYQVLTTRYYKSTFSDVVYAVTDFPGTQYDQLPDGLDYAEWASVGFPTPDNGDRQVVQYVQYATGAELFASFPESPSVRLSYAQWSGVGFPAPQMQPYGFHKLTWDDHIVLLSSETDPVVLAPQDWAAFGHPTPLASARLPGDRFYFASGGTDVITYQGPSFAGAITFAQWSAAGFPAPEAYVPAADVVVSSPADGSVPASLLPEVSGTGEPGATITFTVGSGSGAASVGTATVDSAGSWTATLDLTGRYGEQVTVTATQAFAGKDDEQDELALDLDLGAVVAAPLTGTVDVPRVGLQVNGTGRPGDRVDLSVAADADGLDALHVGATFVEDDGTWATSVDVGSDAPIDAFLIADFGDLSLPTGRDVVDVQLEAVAADAVVIAGVDGPAHRARSLTPTVTGTGEPGAMVVLSATFPSAGPVDVGHTVVQVDGSWSAVADLTTHYGELVTLTATQAIAASGTTSDEVTDVDLNLGLTITSPASGATVSRALTMTGTGRPGSTLFLTWGNHPHDEYPDWIGSPVVAPDGTWTADVVLAWDAPTNTWLNATAGNDPRAQVAVQVTGFVIP